jgi:hypothetical protein
MMSFKIMIRKSAVKQFSTMVLPQAPIPMVILEREWQKQIPVVEKSNYLEVEKKFAYSNETFEICQSLALSQKKKKILDVYYDSPSFSLTTKDYWLRKRNNSFELKQPKTELSHQCESSIDQYYEITSEKQIMRSINRSLGRSSPASASSSLTQFLSKSQVQPFGAFLTQRTSFELLLPLRASPTSLPKWNIFFQVDFDHVLYTPPTPFSPLTTELTEMNRQFQYQIAEVEMSTDLSLIPLSVEEIFQQVMNKLKINNGNNNHSAVRGKVLEYLFRFQPKHYQALKNSGQLQSKGIYC